MDVVYDNIIYDLQVIGGGSTYWYELSRRLLMKNDVDISFVEVKSAHNNILRKLLDIQPSQIKRSSSGGLLLQRFKRVDVGADFRRGIFHSSYFRVPERRSGLRQICTVHDFTHDLFFSGLRVWLHNYAKKRAVLESDAIITVSENTKRDLLRFYPGIDASRIFTIYNGVSDDFHFLNLRNSHLDTPFFLFVGSRDNYKNFKFAVDLSSTFEDFSLFIVGKEFSGEEAKYLEQKRMGKRYQLFENINNDELNILYNSAYCLLYPSSYEGFGIPLVEAMRAGCPFIALNSSSIPEVAGDAGLLLDRLDIEAGREAVNTIGKIAEQIIAKGFIQSRRFSWESCFHQTYQLYKDIL